tara:strand:- start:174 stop:638 length:465 start_codon:yes stop_codon:yes gene_type:complete
LFPNRAPLTGENFLGYVDKRRCNEFHFYRVVNLKNQKNDKLKTKVIKRGLGFNRHLDKLPPIPHESYNITNNRHLNGTIPMARNELGTAKSEIFICINDQPNLNYNGKLYLDRQDFAAFISVISGMHIINFVHQLPSNNQMLNYPIIIKSANGM